MNRLMRRLTTLLSFAVMTGAMLVPAAAQTVTNGIFDEPIVDESMFAPIKAPVAMLMSGMGEENVSAVTQVGADNYAVSDITGTGNLSIIGQAGSGNVASQKISGPSPSTSDIVGTGNFALIAQAGSNNRAVQVIEGSGSSTLLVQGGSNNDVFQGSFGDNNFQAIGVTGTNNQVAFVQTGNDLNGALDLRNSTNSTVVAMQTSQSGRYLMPSGLGGLNNQIVIMVPGRMYVLPRP